MSNVCKCTKLLLASCKVISRASVTNSERLEDTVRHETQDVSHLLRYGVTTRAASLARNNMLRCYDTVLCYKCGWTIRPLKDNLDLKTPGVYCIPCEWGKVYVGQTVGSIEIRCEEHMRHFRLDQPEESAVGELIIHTEHSMKSNNINRLARVNSYKDSMVKEAIEIQLHPNNFNRDS